jgi:hypothetical protein
LKKVTLNYLEKNLESWKEAVIVFKKESFSKEFSELERSYTISSNAKYFDWQMNGNSLFGDCLDGKDDGVRLDIYMKLLPKEGKRWIEDYCYITKSKED